MKPNPEPEILVPPDMETLEIEENIEPGVFPFKRLVVMILFTVVLLCVSLAGLTIYMNNGKIGEIIPYWIFSILLLTPTAFSYYYFFSYFQQRLRNPFNWEAS